MVLQCNVLSEVGVVGIHRKVNKWFKVQIPAEYLEYINIGIGSTDKLCFSVLEDEHVLIENVNKLAYFINTQLKEESLATSNVDMQGRITLPKIVRNRLKIKEHDTVEMLLLENECILMTKMKKPSD